METRAVSIYAFLTYIKLFTAFINLYNHLFAISQSTQQKQRMLFQVPILVLISPQDPKSLDYCMPTPPCTKHLPNTSKSNTKINNVY